MPWFESRRSRRGVLVMGAAGCLFAAGLSTAGFSTMQGLELENTQWMLVRLGVGPEVTPRPGRDSPHVLFGSSQGQMTGYGGCNRFGAEYELKAEALTVGPVVSTRMACPSRMDVERDLMQALSQTRAWRVVERRLELLDAEKDVVALFEAQ